MSLRLLRSSSTDIFLNLAIEDRLFRTFSLDDRLLFLWTNDAAVVIGRYQNPWLECRAADIARDGIALARRQSGGGTVWHDRGNLCFTFMSATPRMDRRANIALVVRALRGLGLRAETNDRLDVLVEGRKVSGSAFRESSGRSFHHGTLLVRADLDALGRYLASGGVAHNAKGVKSVRSPVANLADSLPGLTVDRVEEALAAEARTTLEASPDTPPPSAHPVPHALAGGAVIEELDTRSLAAAADVAADRERLISHEWRFGASPPFTLRMEARGASLLLDIEGGAVRTARLEAAIGSLGAAAVAAEIEGLDYDERTVAAALRELAARTADGEAAAKLGSFATALEEGRFA